jgi:hypothetical protein
MQAASNIEAKRGPLFGVMVLDFSRVLTGALLHDAAGPSMRSTSCLIARS